MPIENPQELKKLVDLVRETVSRDEELRTKYVVGHKFRFVQERLKALLDQLEKKLIVEEKKVEQAKSRVSEDEALVYVYLFNAQGIIIRNWENMLTPKVFYEYSVNRPIYADRTCIESLVRSKKNKTQHAFLTIAVKKVDILTSDNTQNKDALGNPVIRVREGSLSFDKLIQFTHNEVDYEVSVDGELIKSIS